MLGGDGTNSSTQVPVVRHVWVPVVTFCRARHLMLPFPEVLGLVVHTRY
jgi:hypothetical protein